MKIIAFLTLFAFSLIGVNAQFAPYIHNAYDTDITANVDVRVTGLAGKGGTNFSYIIVTNAAIFPQGNNWTFTISGPSSIGGQGTYVVSNYNGTMAGIAFTNSSPWSIFILASSGNSFVLTSNQSALVAVRLPYTSSSPVPANGTSTNTTTISSSVAPFPTATFNALLSIGPDLNGNVNVQSPGGLDVNGQPLLANAVTNVPYGTNYARIDSILGSDSTGKVGNDSMPFASIQSAISALNQSTLADIRLTAGEFFDVGKNPILATNLMIEGAGTIINLNNTNFSSLMAVSNLWLNGVTIDVTYGAVAGFANCVGAYRNPLTAGSGSVTPSPTPFFIHAKNCTFKGVTDTVFMDGTNCETWWDSCYFNSSFDFLRSAVGTVGSKMHVWNCHFYGVNTNQAYSYMAAIEYTGETLDLIGSTIDITNLQYSGSVSTYGIYTQTPTNSLITATGDYIKVFGGTNATGMTVYGLTDVYASLGGASGIGTNTIAGSVITVTAQADPGGSGTVSAVLAGALYGSYHLSGDSITAIGDYANSYATPIYAKAPFIVDGYVYPANYNTLSIAAGGGSITYVSTSLLSGPGGPNDGSGLTNLLGAMVTYSTNASFVAATSLVINHTAFTDGSTNYTVTAPNDLVGATVTARTPTNFTIGFTSATLTAQTIEGACIHR